MGREAKLTVSDGRTRAEARVHLDSELLTIGPPFRLKLKLAELAGCEAGPDGLAVAGLEARLTLALPAKEAAAWAKAMLNPPSLATKLGLKPGVTVAALGALPSELESELKALKPAAAKLGAAISASLTFAALPGGVSEAQLGKLAQSLPPKSAVWLVYRKGETNGDALIHAARAAGLKDTKVARISETHTGLRFIPAS